MEIPLLSLRPNCGTTSSLGGRGGLTYDSHGARRKWTTVRYLDNLGQGQIRCVKASAERSRSSNARGEVKERAESSSNSGSSGISSGGGGGFSGSVMEVTTFDRGFGDAAAASDSRVWEKIGAVVRLSYGIG